MLSVQSPFVTDCLMLSVQSPSCHRLFDVISPVPVLSLIVWCYQSSPRLGTDWLVLSVQSPSCHILFDVISPVPVLSLIVWCYQSSLRLGTDWLVLSIHARLVTGWLILSVQSSSCHRVFEVISPVPVLSPSV